MTMKLIRHGTRRAGFTDWPDYDNQPGSYEKDIATYAYPDPLWIQGPPPRTYNTGKTVTGARVAEKIRDLRLRKEQTGTTVLPRLMCKTHPRQIQAAQEVDFEEEVARYKNDIKKDIRHLKSQSYHEPAWVKAVLRNEQGDLDPQETNNTSSSSSWEQPLTDSQAIHISDYILTREEELQFMSEEEDGNDHQEQGNAPAWEQAWENDRPQATHDYSNELWYPGPVSGWPIDLRHYGDDADDEYWSRWLAEVSLPTSRTGYQPFDDLLRHP